MALTSPLVLPFGGPAPIRKRVTFDDRPGRDIRPFRNPNGLYDFEWDDTGNPVFDNSAAHTVLSLQLERRGEYVFDRTGKRGSRLHTIKLDRGGTRDELEAANLEALQLAIDDGRITNVSTEARRVAPGFYYLDTRWHPTGGSPQTGRLPIKGP